MYSTIKFNKKDDIITQISLKFSVGIYQNLSCYELTKLSTTTTDLFRLINKFGNLHKINNEIVLYLVDDQLQESKSDTCEIFQWFFHKDLFDALAKIQIINDKKLTRKTISKFLNELFLLHRAKIECLIGKFAKENDITRSWNIEFCPKYINLDLFKLLTVARLWCFYNYLDR